MGVPEGSTGTVDTGANVVCVNGPPVDVDCGTEVSGGGGVDGAEVGSAVADDEIEVWEIWEDNAKEAELEAKELISMDSVDDPGTMTLMNPRPRRGEA